MIFVAHRTLDRGLSHKFQSAGGQFLDGKQVVIFIVFNSLVKSFLDSLVVLSPRETVCNFFGVFLTDCCDELSELFVNSLLILELHLRNFFQEEVKDERLHYFFQIRLSSDLSFDCFFCLGNCLLCEIGPFLQLRSVMHHYYFIDPISFSLLLLGTLQQDFEASGVNHIG